MDLFGINGKKLSHTQIMENNLIAKSVPTKANAAKPAFKQEEKRADGVFLAQKDAEEYRAYRRRKRLGEISAAISATESSLIDGQDVQKVCERAVRLRQTAVKIPASKLTQAAYYLAGSKVALDCVVGGNGETLPKVKAYEAKLAVKRKAREITAVVTPSFLDACRYGEIKKELRRIARAIGKAKLKVRVDCVSYNASLSRVARVACEVGASFFSVPYFAGCERLRLDLTGGCKLEVSNVESVEEFKRLSEIGVGRIVTDKAWEIYTELLKEADEETRALFIEQKEVEKTKQPPTPNPQEKSKKEESTPPPQEPKKQEEPKRDEQGDGDRGLRLPAVCPQYPTPSETDYRCQLVGTELKFL